MRSLQGGEYRLTKLGKGFFRDKYCKYLVHVPVIIRAGGAAGGTRARLQAQGLAAGEQAGRGHNKAPGAPTEEQVAQRVRQQGQRAQQQQQAGRRGTDFSLGLRLQGGHVWNFLRQEAAEQRRLPRRGPRL